MTTKKVFIQLAAENDTNGNPRRVFVVFDADSGQIIEAIDEGYGNPETEILKKYPGAVSLGRFATTPKEYRALVRMDK